MFSRCHTSLKLTALLFLTGALSACSQAQNDNLFSDMKDSACPPGCVDSLKADESEMTIKFLSGTILLPASATRVDVGGECYASLYPRNEIAVTLKYADGSTVNSSLYRYWGINTSSTVPSCANGKFDLSVDFSLLPAPTTTNLSSYILEVRLFANDDSGTHTNESEGFHSIIVKRTN